MERTERNNCCVVLLLHYNKRALEAEGQNTEHRAAGGRRLKCRDPGRAAEQHVLYFFIPLTSYWSPHGPLPKAEERVSVIHFKPSQPYDTET